MCGGPEVLQVVFSALPTSDSEQGPGGLYWQTSCHLLCSRLDIAVVLSADKACENSQALDAILGGKCCMRRRVAGGGGVS